MILFLQDTWFVWLLISVVGGGLMQFLARNRSTDVQPGMATKSDQFSMRTVFLSFKSGEASLFFTVSLTLASLCMFSIGLAKDIGGLLP